MSSLNLRRLGGAVRTAVGDVDDQLTRSFRCWDWRDVRLCPADRHSAFSRRGTFNRVFGHRGGTVIAWHGPCAWASGCGDAEGVMGGDPDAGAVVEVLGLTKSFGDVRAVAGIDLRIGRGEVFALLGPNGAGKTTTVEILEGYQRRDSGQVTVFGLVPARDRIALK